MSCICKTFACTTSSSASMLHTAPRCGHTSHRTNRPASSAHCQCRRTAAAQRKHHTQLLRPSQASSVDDTSQHVDEVAAETAARLGWDPSGLLPPIEQVGSTDHFARRAKQKQAQQQQAKADQVERSADESSADEQPLRTSAASAALAQAYSQAVRTQQTAPQQEQQPLVEQQQRQATQQLNGNRQAATAVQEQPARLPPAAPVICIESFERIPAKWLGQGGIPASDATAYDRQAFIAKLAEKFIPIDLDYPGLRIVNYDPAIFTVDGFMTPEECASWQQHAVASGCLQQSKIGGGNASSAAGQVNVYGSRRTSSSLLLDQQTQAKSPALTALMRVMQSRGKKLLAHLDEGRSWGATGKMPAGGQYCFESPQVARYESGQHFLAHEDGFPALLAMANGFQRHATLLLYLNSVSQGGATHFDHLGISVQPKQGMALLFFPSFANGTADPRSLHTAQDAVDTKWVMQQWIARGYPVPNAVLKAVKVAAMAGPEAAAGQSVKEVFRVPVSSSTSSSSGAGGSDGRKSRKGGSKGNGKKGFGRR